MAKSNDQSAPIGVARIFSGGWRLFLVVGLKTQAKTAAKLTTPAFQFFSPDQQKISLNIWLLLCLGGALTTFPYKLRPFFSALGGARAASAPPGYACDQRINMSH